MDPAGLPLELFVEILRYLSPGCVWQLRRTAKTWNNALSTTLAVSIALQGIELDEFKREYLRKPKTCVDMSITSLNNFDDWSFAFHGRHTAYMRHTSIGAQGKYNITLHVQDIEGGRWTKALQCRLQPSLVCMHDFIAFVAESSLYIFTLQGTIFVRQLPHKHRGGLIDTSKSKIAILRDRQGPNRAMLKQNTLWIYDIQQDTWSTQDVPQTRISSVWQQHLIVDDHVVSIVSTGLQASRTKDCLFDGCPYIVHVRSGDRSWTHEYTTKLAPSLYVLSSQSPRWSGSDYDVGVTSPYGCHTLRLTTQKFISADAGHRARWHDNIFKGIAGGIELPIGFLWQDTRPWRPKRPAVLLINHAFLVSMFIDTYGLDTQICAFSRLGHPQDLLPLFRWESMDRDKEAQIARRERLFLNDSTEPYVVPGTNVIATRP